MIQLESDSLYGFTCPHCNKTWSVENWGTEYNTPIQGVSTVFCSACDKHFNIDVKVRINIFTVIPNSLAVPSPL